MLLSHGDKNLSSQRLTHLSINREPENFNVIDPRSNHFKNFDYRDYNDMQAN
jgi:hypothetical protein